MLLTLISYKPFVQPANQVRFTSARNPLKNNERMLIITSSPQKFGKQALFTKVAHVIWSAFVDDLVHWSMGCHKIRGVSFYRFAINNLADQCRFPTLITRERLYHFIPSLGYE